MVNQVKALSFQYILCRAVKITILDLAIRFIVIKRTGDYSSMIIIIIDVLRDLLLYCFYLLFAIVKLEHFFVIARLLVYHLITAKGRGAT